MLLDRGRLAEPRSEAEDGQVAEHLGMLQPGPDALRSGSFLKRRRDRDRRRHLRLLLAGGQEAEHLGGGLFVVASVFGVQPRAEGAFRNVALLCELLLGQALALDEGHRLGAQLRQLGVAEGGFA
ncbi:MAG: hypothetical protein DCF29_09435 [Alphaproteobacteria bacterium]|nr:MAG: hypothetical protein DCF29_09435 [Alphaproteobacteria bacterium]